MSSAIASGNQRPRVSCAPLAHSTVDAGRVLELCEIGGINLDPWQEHVLLASLGKRADGKWAAFEVGLVVPRQNGKSELLIARMLAGLFLLDEQLLIYSAHQFDTAMEVFYRLVDVVENTPEFRSEVALNRGDKVGIYSHGQEGIKMKSGQRVRFKARTSGGGRGFSCDCLMLDEAMILPEAAHGATLPTLSARPNPQVWYCGSAVDQHVHADGIVFSRIRERGVAQDDPRLAYFEWSAAGENPEMVPPELARDPETWAQANPGLGIRISEEHVAAERRSMDPRNFAVERLGIGDWPRTDGMGGIVINPADWADLFDPKSAVMDPKWVSFAYDITPDRSAGSIAVAGAREDGLIHVEVAEYRRGTGWIVPWFAERLEQYPAMKPVCDASGPAGPLLPDFARAGIEVIPVNAKEHADATGSFFDGVDQRVIRHLNTPELAAAIKGAVKRPLGDAWAWSRKNSGVDISPLVAVTLALWGYHAHQPEPKAAPRLINLAEV